MIIEVLVLNGFAIFFFVGKIGKFLWNFEGNMPEIEEFKDSFNCKTNNYYNKNNEKNRVGHC